MNDLHGRNVGITAGLKEFIGRIGTVEGKEGKLYRIRFYPAVFVEGVGKVTDDLWERSGFKLLRD